MKKKLVLYENHCGHAITFLSVAIITGTQDYLVIYGSISLLPPVVMALNC